MYTIRVDLVMEKSTGEFYLHRRSKKGNHVFRSVTSNGEWVARFTEPILLYKWSDIQFERNYTVYDKDFVGTNLEAARYDANNFIKA